MLQTLPGVYVVWTLYSNKVRKQVKGKWHGKENVSEGPHKICMSTPPDVVVTFVV